VPDDEVPMDDPPVEPEDELEPAEAPPVPAPPAPPAPPPPPPPAAKAELPDTASAAANISVVIFMDFLLR